MSEQKRRPSISQRFCDNWASANWESVNWAKEIQRVHTERACNLSECTEWASVNKASTWWASDTGDCSKRTALFDMSNAQLTQLYWPEQNFTSCLCPKLYQVRMDIFQTQRVNPMVGLRGFTYRKDKGASASACRLRAAESRPTATRNAEEMRLSQRSAPRNHYCRSENDHRVPEQYYIPIIWN